MGFAKSRQIYEALPLAMKRAVGLIPFGWLAGRAYQEVLIRDSLFNCMERAEIEAYQERKLGELLLFATDQVPAYRPLRGAVTRHKPIEALKAFPLLDKDVVQANQREYLSCNFEKTPHYETTTGGTSGNQLKIYLDDSSQSAEMGFMHRQWMRVGYSPEQRKATFRGVSFPNLKHGVYWQQNPIYNELQFSPFHMSEKNLSLYIDRIIDFEPSYLHGYPSAIDTLAEFLLRNDLSNKIPFIKSALLGSEGTSLLQRKRIEKAFQTRVYTWYGHSERVILAGECEKNDSYHCFPDYGILELIDEDGKSCEKEGERGEIVGTGLLNRCMPLIRYKTGDYATRLDNHCECGRCWDRFTNVEGRWKQDMVFGKNGSRISIAALNMHGPFFDNVVRYQYVQDTPGICTIKVMAAPNFTEDDKIAVENAYNNKAGSEVKFNVKVVKDIPLTSLGKLKLLDSKLNIASDHL